MPRKIISLILPAAAVAAPLVALAAVGAVSENVCGLLTKLNNALGYVVYVLVFVVVVMVLYAAFLFITGTDDNTTKAKKIILYALVGLIVALVAWSAPRIVEQLLGVNIGTCS